MFPRALALFALLAIVACGGWTPNRQEVTPSQPVDQVKILSAQPSNGSVLGAGSAVTLSYSFSYQLATGDSASIIMVIADQQGHTLNEPGTYPTASIARGTGTAQLTYTMTVPASGVSSIVVNFPMFIGTATRSQPMDAVQYSVK